MHNLLSNFLIVMLCVHVYVDKNIYEYIRMKEIIEKAEKSFRKASLRDHRMKVVNLVKVNTLSMQWPVPNLVQLYYASVVKSPFKSCILYDSAVHVLQIFFYRNTILLWRCFETICWFTCYLHTVQDQLCIIFIWLLILTEAMYGVCNLTQIWYRVSVRVCFMQTVLYTRVFCCLIIA